MYVYSWVRWIGTQRQVYVGITNNIVRRLGTHARDGGELKDAIVRTIANDRQLARRIEQKLIDELKLGKLENKINSIAEKKWDAIGKKIMDEVGEKAFDDIFKVAENWLKLP